jgi:hypothetical protein
VEEGVVGVHTLCRPAPLAVVLLLRRPVPRLLQLLLHPHSAHRQAHRHNS